MLNQATGVQLTWVLQGKKTVRAEGRTIKLEAAMSDAGSVAISGRLHGWGIGQLSRIDSLNPWGTNFQGLKMSDVKVWFHLKWLDF